MESDKCEKCDGQIGSIDLNFTYAGRLSFEPVTCYACFDYKRIFSLKTGGFSNCDNTHPSYSAGQSSLQLINHPYIKKG